MNIPPRSIYSSPSASDEANFPNWDLTLELNESPLVKDQIILNVGYRTNSLGYHDNSGFTVTLSITKSGLSKEVSLLEASWHTLVALSAKKPTPQAELQNAIAEIAEKGEFVFRQIFAAQGPFINMNDARNLKELRQFLKSKKILRILVKAGGIHVPWNLLYDRGLRPEEPLDGFLGYRHIWVQIIEDPQCRLSQADLKAFGARKPLAFSAQLNAELDIYRSAPEKQPSTDLDLFLRELTKLGHAAVTYRYDKNSFIRDLPQTVAANEDFIYFCCHGHVDTLYKQHLEFRKGDTLSAQDIDACMGDDALLLCQPLVFINACFLTRIDQAFYHQFAPAFLFRGANAIIGPVAEVPSQMATQFALLFFRQLLHGNRTLPDGTLVSIPDVLHETRQQWFAAASWLDLRALLYAVVIRKRIPFELKSVPVALAPAS